MQNPLYFAALVANAGLAMASVIEQGRAAKAPEPHLTQPPPFTAHDRLALEAMPIRLASLRHLRPVPWICPVCGESDYVLAGIRHAQLVLYVPPHITRRVPVSRCPLRGLVSVDTALSNANDALTPLPARVSGLVYGLAAQLRRDYVRLALRNMRRRLGLAGGLQTPLAPTAPQTRSIVSDLADTYEPGPPMLEAVRAMAQQFGANFDESSLDCEYLRVHSGPRPLLAYAYASRLYSMTAIYNGWAGLWNVCAPREEDTRAALHPAPGVSLVTLLWLLNAPHRPLRRLYVPQNGTTLDEALVRLASPGEQLYEAPAFPKGSPEELEAALALGRVLAAQSRQYRMRSVHPETGADVRARLVVRGARLLLRVDETRHGAVSLSYR